jgi:predicted AAA+ superfamily ATPase
MIKRKINSNSFQSTSDDTELSEMLREERESKLASKRSMDDVCTNLMKNMDEMTKKYNETERRVDLIAKRNDEYIVKNKMLMNELSENR